MVGTFPPFVCSRLVYSITGPTLTIKLVLMALTCMSTDSLEKLALNSLLEFTRLTKALLTLVNSSIDDSSLTLKGAYSAASVVGNDLLNALMTDAGVGDPYDIRKASDPTDPLQDALATYLNLPETRKKLGVVGKFQDF